MWFYVSLLFGWSFGGFSFRLAVFPPRLWKLVRRGDDMFFQEEFTVVRIAEGISVWNDIIGVHTPLSIGSKSDLGVQQESETNQKRLSEHGMRETCGKRVDC